MKASKLVLILGVFVVLSFASAQELFSPRTGVSPGGAQTLSAPVLPTLNGGLFGRESKSSVATRNEIVSGAVVSKTEAPLVTRTYKFTLRNKGGSVATAMLPNGERLTLAAGETRTVEMRSSENLFKLSRSPISIQSGRKTTQVFAKTSAKSLGGEFMRWTKGQPVPDVVGVLASFVDKTMPAKYGRDYAADLRSVARGNDLEKLNIVESLRISIYGNPNLQPSIKNSANELFSLGSHILEGNFRQVSCVLGDGVSQMSINECNLKGGVIIDPKCPGEKTIQTAWTDIFIKKAWAQAVAFEPGNYKKDKDGEYSEFAKKVNSAWKEWLRSKGYDPEDPSSVKKFGDSYIADKYDCDNFAYDFFQFLLKQGLGKPSYVFATSWSHIFNDIESPDGEVIFIEPQNGEIFKDSVIEQLKKEGSFIDEKDGAKVEDLQEEQEAIEVASEKRRAEYTEIQKDITPHKEWEYSKRDNKWEYVLKKFNSITDGAKDFKDKIEKETGQEFEIYYRDSAASETGAGFFYLIFKGQDPESRTPPDELMKPGADY